MLTKLTNQQQQKPKQLYKKLLTYTQTEASKTEAWFLGIFYIIRSANGLSPPQHLD